MSVSVATPECDKEIAARESKEGAFAAFLAWIGERGWRFCSLALDDHFYPVDDRLIQRLVPTPDEGGSQELGEWLDWNLPGLALCEHKESNGKEIEVRVIAENGGKRPFMWTWTMEWDYMPKGWYPVLLNVEGILASYFGIDLAAASRERDEILAAYRARLAALEKDGA